MDANGLRYNNPRYKISWLYLNRKLNCVLITWLHERVTYRYLFFPSDLSHIVDNDAILWNASTTIDCEQFVVPSKLLDSRDKLKSSGKAFLGFRAMWQCIHSWLNHRRMLHLQTVSHDQDDYKL